MSMDSDINIDQVKAASGLAIKVIPAIILIILLVMSAGINDAGNRTVVQYPTGKLFVKFTPGIYFKWFGSTEVYRDVLTYDFGVKTEGVQASLNQSGIDVRYQDGGTGSVYGISRFSLPNDEPTMLALHKAFRSNKGLASKLVSAVTEEGMNLTAGLMSSEEAYTEKRGTFKQWAKDQIAKGPFKTKLKEIVKVDEGTGKKVVKNIPVIDFGENGMAKHMKSDLKEYGIVVNGFQVTDWNFEQKTLEQISTKREATMAIITAKANAERAKQDAITTEEQGKANVMTAKYEKEVEKQRAIVTAEQIKEVAIIKAKQLVDVATQQKLEAEQKKLAAKEYKQEQILRGEGDGQYKSLVMKGDGGLTQKLETYEAVQGRFAKAIEQQKWVPEVQMGLNGSGTGSAATDLINMLNVNTAKDLALDMSMRKK